MSSRYKTLQLLPFARLQQKLSHVSHRCPLVAPRHIEAAPRAVFFAAGIAAAANGIAAAAIAAAAVAAAAVRVADGRQLHAFSFC